MQKTKHFIVISLAIIWVISCSPYQKMLNGENVEEQYKMATELYEKGDYSKAIALFERVTPFYAGKPQMERIQFMVAESHFKTKSYNLSGYYFSRFASNYPKSSKHEEALFLSAKGYYLAAPKYSLDQTDTRKALEVLQQYINTYPDSDKLKEANDIYKILSNRIEKKYFEISKQNFTLERYNAAIVSFENFLEDFPGTTYKEKAYYYKFRAAYELGIKSIDQKKEERIKNAISLFLKLKKSFPESEFLKELEDSKKILDQQLQELTK